MFQVADKGPPLLNNGSPLPRGSGTMPPFGSGAATLPLGGGGGHPPRASQAPNFKQEFGQQDIPMGAQYNCPHITKGCLEAIWKTYSQELLYARVGEVANLDGSSVPPKPKLPTEIDYHPCANFGILLAQYELLKHKEPATDQNQLKERVADLNAHAWELGFPFFHGFE